MARRKRFFTLSLIFSVVFSERKVSAVYTPQAWHNSTSTACGIFPNKIREDSGCEEDWPQLRATNGASSQTPCFRFYTQEERADVLKLFTQVEGGVEICLPRAYILGPEKSGTTSLFYKIIQHPHIIPPTTSIGRPGKDRKSVPLKETGFWSTYGGQDKKQDQNFFKLASYANKFKSAFTKARHSGLMVPEEVLTLDATPYTLYRAKPTKKGLFADASAQRLFCTVPTARLIVMIRDPVDRTWSDYLYYSRLIKKEMLPGCFRKEDGYMPSAADFEMSISRQIPLARKCLRLSKSNHTDLDQLKRNCNELWREQLSTVPFMVTGRDKRCWARAGRLLVSLVVPHIFSWLRYFPCDQMLLIPLTEYHIKQAHTLRRIFEFLQVPPLDEPTLTKLVQARDQIPDDENSFNRANMRAPIQGISMLPETRQKLQEFFSEFWHTTHYGFT